MTKPKYKVVIGTKDPKLNQAGDVLGEVGTQKEAEILLNTAVITSSSKKVYWGYVACLKPISIVMRYDCDRLGDDLSGNTYYRKRSKKRAEVLK